MYVRILGARCALDGRFVPEDDLWAPENVAILCQGQR